MHTYNKRVLKNLIGKYISPFIVEERLAIPEWKSRTALHPAPGVIVPDGKPPETLRLGDAWRIGYDDTRYFEATVLVPDRFGGRKCYLCIDFGGEALVRINGKIVGGVSSRMNSGWVGRNEILFPVPLKAGELLQIELEAAVDCGGFCDAALAGETSMRYELKTAELQCIHEETERFYYEIMGAWDAMEHTNDACVAARLYNAIDDAAHVPDYNAGKERFYADVPKAAALLRERLEAIPYATPGRVILTGHSHLDIAWLWTTNELTRKTARTFANTLALMDAYPDFRFTQSQAATYWFIKEYYPELYPRIKEKVKSGQWEIVGNTWVEADTNIASGESLIRQLLYGREFFLKEFGVSSDIYWLPDCFGFTAALPQIIRRSGMKYFFTSKLQNNDTNEFPMSVFRWRAHSGDEVLAYMQKIGYGGEADAYYITEARARNRQNALVDATMGNFGYGDGGGGCTYAMMERIRSLQRTPGMPEIAVGTAREFFAEVEKAADELPVWDGEMYYENHRGTFTSQAFVKENNRRGEYLLRDCELLGVLCGETDRAGTEALWRLLLVNQFHDILPGTSIHAVFENTKKEYARLRKEAGALRRRRLTQLSARCGGENSVVVWNLLPRPVSGAVSVDVPKGACGILDEAGRAMRSEYTEHSDRTTITFLAEDVPAVGCRRFTLINFEFGTQCVTAAPDLLENEYLRAAFGRDGALTSLFDKEQGREILSGPGNLLSVSHDKPIHESAWNLENDYMMHMDYLSADGVAVLCATPVRGVLRATYRYGSSVITQDITLTADSRRLEFRTHVDWNEREKVLKAEFPVNVRARYSTFEIAHGATERPTFANNPYERAMFECCAHKWIDLSEGEGGVALLNDCKYGHDVQGNVMRITLMRGPVVPDREADVCEQDFTYAVYPHAGNWNDADVAFEAQKLNEPLTGVFTAVGGAEAAERSWFTCSAPNLVLDALKPAQDDRGVILRVYEAERKRTRATVSLDVHASRCFACNLMEEDEEELPLADGAVTFDIAPFEVRTFRFLP